MPEKSSFEQQLSLSLKQDLSANSYGLLPKILFEVARQRQVSAKRKMAVIIVSFVFLIFLTFLSWSSARLQLAQSGTGQMLTLLFTDLRSVMANWQSYALLLLESLPVFPVILVLGSFTGLLYLFKLFIQTMRQTAILIHKQ
jgi:hypothetical protein